jgi:hypothetical protein
MTHIGKEEANREWKRLFNSENRNYQLKDNKTILDRLKLSFELIREPVLLGVPYLFHRFSSKK